MTTYFLPFNDEKVRNSDIKRVYLLSLSPINKKKIKTVLIFFLVVFAFV